MNALYLALVLLSAPLVLCYDEIYDKVDVDKIIGDEQLFDAYLNCLLDKGPCEAEHSAKFKEILPEVIATNCAKCTDIQKEHVRKTVKALSEKKPETFVEFKKKYDPEAKYEKEFSAFVLGTN